MIPVVFAINDAYLNPLRVALRSLYRHANSSTEYDIYVLNYQLDITCRTVLKLDLAELHERGAIHFCDVTSEEYTSLNIHSRWGAESRLRYFAGKYIKSYLKVIYLDTDVLILGDLSELYHIKLGGHLFAAVMEERSTYRNYVISEYFHHQEGRDVLPFRPQECSYMNSGVLVMNLELMRATEFTKMAVELSRTLPNYWLETSRHDFFVMPDQDVLYYLANSRSEGIYFLPDRYNHIVGYYYYNDMTRFVDKELYGLHLGYINSMSAENNEQAWENYQPIIIHYADSAPWNKRRGLVPYEDLYRAYAKEIGWQLPNKWLINMITWAKRRFFYRKTTRDAWGRKGIALLALNLFGLIIIVISMLLLVFS
ncbi:glycosyltransferase family 8 protein [Entomospira entomophila]|uniref:Glycosyltransferase family 8 protein n=1 Tax=Entomospira entomophila TaxID=2719988 RepID=A0A968GB83_9SPIO|nr:glycosyltransferase family 8 protein [Entomospira entomophilus]NIZ40196.1 glycosyltransferase family 8 protein [Entomospira entomophilus]WDI35755.1 glycosyltransferase family 8 protein [Entomospira entomophilus]